MDFLGKTIPFLTGQQLQMESSEETVRTTEVQGFKAFETFRHQDKQGELNISVADRFWVKIDGEGIDNLEVLTKVAQTDGFEKTGHPGQVRACLVFSIKTIGCNKLPVELVGFTREKAMRFPGRQEGGSRSAFRP